MLGRVDLTQRQLVVVPVVENVHEVGVERMNIVELRKFVQDGRQLVVERLLGEFDLSRVELANSGYLEVLADDGGRLALGAREDDIDEILGGGNHRDLLEVVVTHLLEYPEDGNS